MAARVKVGIVVPYSWSFGGGVVDHAEAQRRALTKLGIETRLLIGNDPPGSFSRVLHPRQGRHGEPPPGVIPLGRSVIVPGNGALSNLVLSPATLPRLRRVLATEGFDLLHVHEPLAPIVSPAALAFWEGPVVGTFHAAGDSAWRLFAGGLFGFLVERIDLRIAVSELARRTATTYSGGEYEVIPNGVEMPAEVAPGNRENRIVFLGRHDQRKGLPVLLRAWPRLRRNGLRLRVIGADPLAVRLLLTRERVPDDGIDVLGYVDDAHLTEELSTAKLLVAPSLGNESFGMVITRAFACGTPVVASDIPGYAEVVTPETGALTPPGDVDALAETIEAMLADEPARAERGRAAREHAATRFAWPLLAQRLQDCYERVLAGA
jgi:phosphatidyl-myo-inositol alpha-mannosyltransferase